MNDSEKHELLHNAEGPKNPLFPAGGAKRLIEEARDYLNAAQRAIADLSRLNDPGESERIDQEKYIDTISSLLILLDDKMDRAYESICQSPQPNS